MSQASTEPEIVNDRPNRPLDFSIRGRGDGDLRRHVLAELGRLSQASFAALMGWESQSEQARRARGEVPPYVRVYGAVFFDRAAVLRWIDNGGTPALGPVMLNGHRATYLPGSAGAALEAAHAEAAAPRAARRGKSKSAK